MPQPFAFLARRLDRLVADHAFRSLRGLPPAAAADQATAASAGQPMVNFAANDYLGLAAQRLTGNGSPADEGAVNRGDRWRPSLRRGAAASPLVCGFTELHRELCQRLSALEESEATVLFPSGYAACSGTVATLAGPDDLILSDQLNHASLIDGCRLSSATKMVYPHNDVAAVGRLLAEHRHRYGQVWIVTNSVFGMDGDLAPLAALCDWADRYDARMIVDEAHATGVLGPDGSGAAAELGLKSRLPIRIGTLSKAIGAHGGFVTGPQLVIDYLINFCRPLIFSTAASPLVIAAAIEGVRAIEQQPELRHRVRRHATRVRQHVTGLCQSLAATRRGEDRGSSSAESLSAGELSVPIIPWIVGDNAAALAEARRAAEVGLFLVAIRPPTVPAGRARLRISLSAAHSDADLDRLLEFLTAAAERLN